ncbi:hypothetical protein BJ170DRAFT_626769 [Xylariales sp. AK1849]|nr:hypothetical protein BJ170DRAFT_626769 [Xylariales sp. AK1849]
MTKTVLPSAWIALSYPLYACDFDPHDANHLVVGGGGGPGSHGVKNKLTLLDLSNASEIENAGEVELSSEEDSVQSLAVGPRKDRTTTVFAGVNGSAEDVKKDRSAHFRAFGLTQPGKTAKSSGVKFSETARETLFTSKDPETYQRVLRLSRPTENASQLGAIATGAFGTPKEPQIVLFDVPTTAAVRWKLRGRLALHKEAMDLDVVQTGPDTYQLAYCDQHEIFTVDISKSEISEPKCVYTLTSESDTAGRAAYRCLRYLQPGFLFAVANQTSSKRVVLHGYRLPTRDQENARLAASELLPKTVKKATGLAVRNLASALSSSEKSDTQYVVAVADTDCAISLFTLDYKTTVNVDYLAKLAPFHTIEGVHQGSITGLSFSTFNPSKTSKPSLESSLKLASVSSGSTAAVHSIPLKKFVDTSAPVRKSGPPKVARYVVALRSKGDSPIPIITVTVLLCLFMVLITQVFLEAKGISQPMLGTNNYLPATWTIPLRRTQLVAKQTFSDLLADVTPGSNEKVVIRHDETSVPGPEGMPELHAVVHNEELHGAAKSWDELETEDQNLWKQRLKKTGHWVEDLPDTVFKGVLFGEIGGVIGAMVGEAL